MATKPEEVGLLLVHGIGEQQRLYHLQETGRELASYVANNPTVIRLSVLDETSASEPRIVLHMTVKDDPRSVARQLRLCLHEVWWADLGIKGGALTQIKFWLWGLGQWGAEAVTKGTPWRNTEQLMLMPRFPYQRSRKQRAPFLRHRLLTHLVLFGTALLAFLTFFTWSAAKRLIAFLRGRLPSPSLISLYLGDVMIYERPPAPGHGTLEDPDLPIRTTIRRRMVRGMTCMASRPYKRWYILAHSLGTVPAFNALQETEIALPNYLNQSEWNALPAALKTTTPFVPQDAKPTIDQMMPRRPPWLSKTDGISRPALFERFQGFVTYGCPLDKFATLWPRIVPLNKQTAVFQPGCEWINLYEPTDPVAAHLDAFAKPPPDPAEKPGKLEPIEPKNFACRALWVFLLSHIYYFSPTRRRTRVMAAAITEALLAPGRISLSRAAARARIGRRQVTFRYVLGGLQILALALILSIAAGYLLILLGNVLKRSELSDLSWNVFYVLSADLGIVFLAGISRIASDVFRPRYHGKRPARPR
jgi:hypothetical protein